MGWKGQLASGIVLAVYAAMLCYMVPRHEPWADEAQAWQLARSLGLRDLFARYIHYEVSPGLWHLFLWVLVRLGVTYAGMHWISAAIALAGMALLVVAAPFPLFLRLLLPFTYFFEYQYAVVARSYVLFGPLLFLLACIWPERRRRPILVAVLLSLLANLTFHGLAIASGLAILLALEWWPERKDPEIVHRDWLIAGGVFLALACFAAWSVHPPADAQWYTNAQKATKVVGLKSFVTKYPHGYRWYERLPLGLQLLLAFLSRVRFALTAPLGGPPWLGEILWALLLWRWIQEKQLRYVLPLGLLALFCGATRVLAHHVGLIWLLFVFLWWCTWPEGKAGRVQMAVTVVAVLCMLLQVRWTVEAVRFDAANPYSPDRDGAPVLQAYLDRGEKVDLMIAPSNKQQTGSEFDSVGLEPYFSREPFANARQRFFVWTYDGDMRAAYLEDVQKRSAVVLMENADWDQEMAPEGARLQALGYRLAHKVCGRVFYPSPPFGSPVLCHSFFEPPR